MGTLKATTSDEDKYCMLDSGVMVVLFMEGMKGDRTMCSLVGDNIFGGGRGKCLGSSPSSILGSNSWV